jgi:PAS domain S-box-containing protein
LENPKPEYLRQYETLVEGMAQGVFLQLADGTLVDVNPAALEMFGLDRDQFFGRTSFSPGWKVINEEGTELLPEQHPSMVALRTGLPLRDTVVGVYNTKKESFVWMIANAIPVTRVEEDTPYQVFVTLQDITERKKAEVLIRESNEELDAFVHTVAHDLRSPLTPIIGFAEILQEDYKGQLDEQGLFYLKAIEKAGIEMLNFMGSLLSLAKSGELERPVKRVSTDKVVAGVIKNLKTDISKTGVVLQTNSLPSVRVPKTFLIQIFDNLISNAIRYAGKNGDIIEVGGEQKGEQIRFFVRDHGPGIPEQERKHIFEIFYRGSNKGEVKGTGIGLATVYKIARNCGGRVWVEETHGGGCTFWVELEDTPRP